MVTGSSEIAEELPDHVIIAGIGCAMPGVIDPGGEPPRTTIHRAPSLGWVDVPFGVILGEAMRERFGAHVPVLLGNDAKREAAADRHPLKKVLGADEVASSAATLEGSPLRLLPFTLLVRSPISSPLKFA